VVASEVKNLATQTAKATDEIRQQIVSMQTVTTSAVSAIRSIGNTIAEINDVTTAIAAAVEEQGAATREIARNISQAAKQASRVFPEAGWSVRSRDNAAVNDRRGHSPSGLAWVISPPAPYSQW